MFLLIRTLSDWFWNLSPILPGGLVLAMWISLFASWRIRAVLAGEIAEVDDFCWSGLAFLIFFVAGLGREPYRWDDTAI